MEQKKIVDSDTKMKTISEAENTLALNYKRIGFGNNRIVYDLNNGFVLKVAISESGIQSNETEFNTYQNCPLILRVHLCPVEELGNGWIIMEKALNIVPDNEEYQHKVSGLQNKFLKSGIKANDMRIRNLRLSNDGKIIVIDYGAFKYTKRK
ncbi:MULTISPECIES: hypothetical protein [Bacillus]|nr:MULTISPECIES: hypothetical protein [Bacillus]